MEVLEALRRRVMVRNFESKPLKAEEIRKLVYAATRAPNGGNMLSREIVFVDDPRYMRMLRDVTPSFLANAPSAIVICTDLEKANSLMGTQGRDILSLVDSGAAAENVALEGEELGLGVSFVRSATDPGVKKVLGIPEGFRVDIIIGVGYKSKNRPPAVKGPKPIIHHNAYGVAWNGGI